MTTNKCLALSDFLADLEPGTEIRLRSRGHISSAASQRFIYDGPTGDGYARFHRATSPTIAHEFDLDDRDLEIATI